MNKAKNDYNIRLKIKAKRDKKDPIEKNERPERRRDCSLKIGHIVTLPISVAKYNRDQGMKGLGTDSVIAI